MQPTKKMDEIIPQKNVKLLTLDCESLGKLIRVKALKLAAMHFAAIGLCSTDHATPSMKNHEPQEGIS